MTDQARLVIELPVWLVVTAIVLFAIDIALELRRAFWERRARKADEAISDYVPRAVSR